MKERSSFWAMWSVLFLTLAFAAGCDSALNIQLTKRSPATVSPVPDETAPSVRIDSPANQATLSGGSIAIEATATDDTGVVRVDFSVDGALKGSVLTSPYRYTATGLGTGPHVVEVRALDAAGNVGSEIISVNLITVVPSPSPSVRPSPSPSPSVRPSPSPSPSVRPSPSPSPSVRPSPSPSPAPSPSPTVPVASCDSVAMPRTTGSVFYVRAGATGSRNGADWTNAYTALPTTLVRNATYYIASGTYAGYRFTTPVSGTQYIVVKKATEADHGTNTGWNTTYGTGKATFGPMSTSTSYIVFDGVTGSGTSGHGFDIYSSAGGARLFEFLNAPKYIYISHTEMHVPSATQTPYSDAVYGNTAASNVVVSYCHIHDISRCPFLWRGWTNIVVEHNYIARNRSTSDVHSEGVSTWGGGNFIFRHNVFEDIMGTAIIVNLTEASRNWEIYGNVFLTRNGNIQFAHGVVSDNSPTGRATQPEQTPIDGLKFYNNTMYNLNGYSTGLSFWSTATRNIEAYNNLWYNCKNVGFIGVKHDYNTYLNTTFYGSGDPTFYGVYSRQAHDFVGSGNPFVNVTGNNFNLTAATTPGMALTAPTYSNSDPQCRQRGLDGVWDRGAYEYDPGQ